MEIRLTPLQTYDQYFLDGATESGEMLSSTAVTLSLYGDASRIHALVERRGHRERDRRAICEDLDRYAGEILPLLPEERRASLLGCGAIHLIKAMADLAEVCSNWAFEDQTIGGAMLPYRRHPRFKARDRYKSTSKVLRQINGRRWIARYVRTCESVTWLQAMARRLFAQCGDALPNCADDPTLTADLNRQLEAFRLVWREHCCGCA